MYPRSYGSAQNLPVSTAGLRPQRQGQGVEIPEPVKPQIVRSVRLPLTQKWVTIVGLGVLVLFVALPISDGAILLNDFNYVFWAGESLPIGVIISLAAVVFIFFVASGSLGPSDGESYTSHNVVTLASTFTTLLGVILILVSVALSYTDTHVTSALSYNCKGSPVTRDVTQYYASLLGLRKTPACASKFSVEQCPGYAAAAPAKYSDYLKRLESNFHCSGFCFASPAAAAAPAAKAAPTAKAAPAAKAAAATTAAPMAPAVAVNKTSFLARTSVQEEVLDRTHRAADLPPALFSQAKYKTSCDGAASRNLRFMAVSMAEAWWWMGIGLIGLGVAAGFAEWVGGPKSR